jgi:hypothetical protein
MKVWSKQPRTKGQTMTPATMTPKQKNNHYRKLNERFDARCDELVKLGFQQKEFSSREFGINVSVFTRKAWWETDGVQTTTAQTIMHADPLVWADLLASFNRG